MVEHMRKEQKIFCLSVSIITIILVGLIYYLLVPTSKATFSNEITNNVKLNKTNNTSTVQNTSQIKSIEIITSVIKENGTTKVITKQVQSTSENNTSITKNQTVTSATSKTIYEENQELIKKISDYYGYKVGYNDESYYYGGSEATLLTDETLANTTLKDIIRKSSQFPTGFFRK
jgi:amino acid permease